MHKIFFAHPDPKLVSLYQSHLGRQFSFDSAHDGMNALRKIKLIRPHLVVSDYDLPILSGLALLKFIRGHENLYSIPFLFFSDHHDVGSALSFGANDWIHRRNPPQILLDKIYNHLKYNQYGIQIH